jgi:ribokinase
LRVVSFGPLLLDRFYAVECFSRPGNNPKAALADIAPSGGGLFQSIALAKAGIEVAHAGAVGRDGAPILEALKANGASLELVSERDSDNGHRIVQLNSHGNSCCFTCEGENNHMPQEEIDRIFDSLSGDEFISVNSAAQSAAYIAQKAAQMGMPASLKASMEDPERLLSVDLGNIKHLSLNLEAGLALTGQRRPQDILDKLLLRFRHLKITLTLGKNGSFYATSNLRLRQCAFQAPEVDLSCAGDAFYGHFLARLLSGAPVWTALSQASQAAALTVAKEGTYCSIPDREEALSFSEAAWLKI